MIIPGRTLLILSLTLLGGCTFTGDSVTNAATAPVRVRLIHKSGATNLFTLPPKTSFFERRGPNEGGGFQHIEAYDSAGNEIGEFDRKDVPNKRGRYGKFIAFVVLRDAVYPVPQKGFGTTHNLNRESLEKFLEQERSYEAQKGEANRSRTPQTSDPQPTK